MNKTSFTMPLFLRFWGKAHPRPDAALWHPLAFHALDVAAAASVLLDKNPHKMAGLAQLIGADQQALRQLILFLIALHDIGKFSAHFQAKSEAAWLDAGLDGILGAPEPKICRHDGVGYAMWEKLGLPELLSDYVEDWSNCDILELWASVTGHHGQPANSDQHCHHWQNGFNGHRKAAALKAAQHFAREAFALFPSAGRLQRPSERDLAILSWALAGLTVLADWIGSNREKFRYTKPRPLADYWPMALKRAQEAVAEAGIMPAGAPSSVAWRYLLPHLAKSKMSPLQQHMLDLAPPEGPFLAVIEDVTGSGKTEAALLLAARLLADGRADGLYFALPTMATANAMFDRLFQSYRRLFLPDAKPSLVLAHGRSRRYDGFTSSILWPNGEDKFDPAIEDSVGETSEAACAGWIADDRRKAFLAHVGAGTIDQALLSVLPSRHQSLRLWGLSGRVLIIDEAHAYDPYVNKELETLLEFHAVLGGSAIVLSATLPRGQRTSLIEAYRRGLAAKKFSLQRQDYPLVTMAAANAVTEEPVETRPKLARVLPVRRLAAGSEAVDELASIAGQGGAVAWIRNAVDDAIEGAALLRERGFEPILLHARFAMGDRLDIEDKVKQRLGSASTSGTRRDAQGRGLVLVGTQVLEQSLDYDVDGMVTDLAPIDLMIQRAGRLWRHPGRERPVASPELLILSPDPEQVEDKEWYRTLLRRAASVYDDHGIVWRSAKALFQAGEIASPEGVRKLIEQVYSEESDIAIAIPPELERISLTADGKRKAAKSTADANLLKLKKGYGGCAQIWTRDTLTPTRLGEPVTVFRLGTVEARRIVPWCKDDNPARAWALSEVSIRKTKASGVPEPERSLDLMIKAAKEQWTKWEQDQPLLVLEPEGEVWRGVVIDKDGGGKTVLYDRLSGLRFAPS